MKSKIISLGLLILTAAIWGFAFVAQVWGMEYVKPFTLNGVRFAVGTVALLPVALFFERGRTGSEERRKTVVASLLAGVVLFVASTLQQMGIERTGSAGVSGFITGLYTVLVPIACYIFFKQKTGICVCLGAICATVGLFLLCYKVGQGFSFGVGELLLLVGALFWTAHVIIIDRLGKDLRPLHLSLGQFSVCAVLGLVFMLLLETPTLGSVWQARWAILYCGVLSVGVAYTLQVVAQKRCDPSVAAIVLSSESMFSALGGIIFKIDRLTVFSALGCIMMFLGIVISQIKIKRKEK